MANETSLINKNIKSLVSSISIRPVPEFHLHIFTVRPMIFLNVTRGPTRESVPLAVTGKIETVSYSNYITALFRGITTNETCALLTNFCPPYGQLTMLVNCFDVSSTNQGIQSHSPRRRSDIPFRSAQLQKFPNRTTYSIKWITFRKYHFFTQASSFLWKKKKKIEGERERTENCKVNHVNQHKGTPTTHVRTDGDR